jgi:AcrR family transcriptional regulator
VAVAENGGRTNQKARTRRAIVQACVELIRRGQPVTMPEVAKAAMVSEATAYRYFPDLASLLSQALAADWPTPAQALAPIEASTDPVERVAFAARFLLEGVAERQGVVRSMIAATIIQPEFARSARPGIRFGLIEQALSPFLGVLESADPNLPAQLRRDLAIVVSAEALFSLTDLCGLSTKDAIDSAEKTASSLTAFAFEQITWTQNPPSRQASSGQPSVSNPKAGSLASTGDQLLIPPS